MKTLKEKGTEAGIRYSLNMSASHCKGPGFETQLPFQVSILFMCTLVGYDDRPSVYICATHVGNSVNFRLLASAWPSSQIEGVNQ